MENNYQALTETIEKRIEYLMSQYESLKQENTLLKAETERLQTENSQQRLTIEEYKANYERLKLACAFGMSEESKKKAHNRITQMVREIDTCLELLK